jgi:hypothetical protein
MVIYDAIGTTYGTTRRPDPQVGAMIGTALGDADCTDGFGAAYWRRPGAYLDPMVRAGMSMLAQLDDTVVQPGIDRLASDLESGRWHRRHDDLLRRDQLDTGYRLVIAEQ